MFEAGLIGSSQASVFGALFLELPLGKLSLHVVRIYERPVQGEALLRNSGPNFEQRAAGTTWHAQGSALLQIETKSMVLAVVGNYEAGCGYSRQSLATCSSMKAMCENDRRCK